jgi:digeranylgeranylglycerophospholipid reductase
MTTFARNATTVFWSVRFRHWKCMNLNRAYDVIVVGAGPAGSMAAREAANAGISVLLLERDRDIGSPVRCAEAIGEDVAREFFDDHFNPRWIAATISRFKFVAPDGTEIEPKVNIRGYVLHRKIFDSDLAVHAAQAGAHVLTGVSVNGLMKREGQVTGVTCLIDGEEHQIDAKLVIGADGVESRVGRWAGISRPLAMRDMETCSQVTLGNLPVEEDMCVFYFSRAMFPGGYAWVFPKGEGCANVGLGIAGNQVHDTPPVKRLDDFIQRYFPGKPVISRTVGGVPCADRPLKISGDGLLLAGDAACQSNPISGGGIAGAMTGGYLAGKVAAEAVKKGDTSGSYLSKYEKMWDERVGRNQRRYYKIKLAIQKLEDDDLNGTARALKDLPEDQQTLLKIFQTALRQKPSLLIGLASLFSPFSRHTEQG